jgi:hypothetical protein
MLFDFNLFISGIEKGGEQTIHVFEEDVKVLQRFKFQASNNRIKMKKIYPNEYPTHTYYETIKYVVTLFVK